MNSDALSPGAWRLLAAAWVVALAATLGALFIGEVMGKTPCTLCWYQRIAMFPLALILGIACLTGDARAARYALPLAAIGLALAAWHSLVYLGLVPQPRSPAPATARHAPARGCRSPASRSRSCPSLPSRRSPCCSTPSGDPIDESTRHHARDRSRCRSRLRRGGANLRASGAGGTGAGCRRPARPLPLAGLRPAGRAGHHRRVLRSGLRDLPRLLPGREGDPRPASRGRPAGPALRAVPRRLGRGGADRRGGPPAGADRAGARGAARCPTVLGQPRAAGPCNAWQAAEAGGLDIAKARQDAARPEIAAALATDLADLEALGVQGTPTFFVNGKPLPTLGRRSSTTSS